MNLDHTAGKPHGGKYVVYLRVSTVKQGEDGLGMKAQRTDVERFLNGGNWEVVAELTEVESSRMRKRPKLQEAIALCKKHKATLIIARLDRLYRNVAATALLLESGVKFICCDMPQADKMMIQVSAVFAERERDLIAERTTKALNSIQKELQRKGAYVSKRGNTIRSLGNTKNPDEAAALGRRVLIRQADDYAAKVMPIVRDLERKGYRTLRDIARGLMERGVETRRGSTTWHPSQVSNLAKRRA
jgi:DNA invertase Pin-like site-specific DNA recombinase